VPALPSWRITPLRDQFCALLPERGPYHPDHPLGCHRRRVADWVIFDKLVQVLVLGCGYRKIADATCSATTIRDRRDQWITLGVFARLELLVLATYDRMVGLELGDRGRRRSIQTCRGGPVHGDRRGPPAIRGRPPQRRAHGRAGQRPRPRASPTSRVAAPDDRSSVAAARGAAPGGAAARGATPAAGGVRVAWASSGGLLGSGRRRADRAGL
jgi:hypothetical protein